MLYLTIFWLYVFSVNYFPSTKDILYQCSLMVIKFSFTSWFPMYSITLFFWWVCLYVTALRLGGITTFILGSVSWYKDLESYPPLANSVSNLTSTVLISSDNTHMYETVDLVALLKIICRVVTFITARILMNFRLLALLYLDCVHSFSPEHFSPLPSIANTTFSFPLHFLSLSFTSRGLLSYV